MSAMSSGSSGSGSSERFDFVVVGSGSAGSVLANRLSADPANRVLLLEAGRPDSWWDLFVHVPAAFSLPVGSRFHDWRYETEPEPFLGGRRLAHARGKLLGGSSSINAMDPTITAHGALSSARTSRAAAIAPWTVGASSPR